MIKKLLSVISLVMLLSVVSFGQWTNVGNWPIIEDDTLNFNNHGMAVDPDGKVWAANFYPENYEVAPGDTQSVRLIRVFNADGTAASFSPIFSYNDGTVDELLAGSNSRGMRPDHEGNILYVDGAGFMYRFNYQTGAGMNKVEVEMSPTAPGVADNGDIYVGPVLINNPIKIYDANFNYLGNAIESSIDYSRAIEVAKDGNTIYYTAFTKGKVEIYTRADEFSEFAATDSLLGLAPESIAWDRKNGTLWIAAGSENNPANGNSSAITYYSNNTWYAWDFYKNGPVDSLKWSYVTADLANERPRAIDFSPDANTAYIGCFGSSSVDFIQKLERDVTPASVEFRANMSVQIAGSSFDAANDKVFLAGSFNDWSNNALEMTDGDSDQIYTAVINDLVPGDRHYFKYVINSDSWENDPNREYVVAHENGSYEAFWNDDLGGGIEITVVFQADMEIEKLSGRFDPANDTVTVRGDFNGWSGTDYMTPQIQNANIYEFFGQYSFFPGDAINYKFAYLTAAGTTWEDGDNRTYTVTSEDINAGFATVARPFNDASTANTTAYDCDITFTVDMNSAVDLNGLAFPSIDNVFIAGSLAPLGWPQGGWPDEDEAVVHFLNDDGTDGDEVASDGVWSVTLTFPKFSLLNFEYKYGANWALASNNGTNDNESGTGVNHSVTLETNYIACMTNDTWGDMSPATLTGVVLDVEEVAGLPTKFDLAQNYPNPFNPTTTINFSIPEAQNVVVKVFDLLGQEVATLVNEELGVGSYNVAFDASSLTSGVYIYTIQAGDFNMTRKMMLLK